MNNRKQKKQKINQLEKQVQKLKEQLKEQNNSDSHIKVRVNISVTAETHQRLKDYANLKNTNVSQAITDWIWSTKFE